MRNVKRIITHPLFVNFRKHYCLSCKGELKKTRNSKIVNSSSPLAKNHDFSVSGGDVFLVGDVKFIWTEFICPECGRVHSVDELFSSRKK